MIKIRRKCKEIERKSFKAEKRAKTGQKQGSTRFRSLRESSAKLALHCETVLQPKRSRCGINVSLRKWSSFAKSFRNSIDSSAKPSLAHKFHFAAQKPPFRNCETAAKLQSMKIPNFVAKAPFRRVFRSCETNFGTRVPFRSCEMGCKNSFFLRKPPFAAKSAFFCENQNDL